MRRQWLPISKQRSRLRSDFPGYGCCIGASHKWKTGILNPQRLRGLARLTGGFLLRRVDLNLLMLNIEA